MKEHPILFSVKQARVYRAALKWKRVRDTESDTTPEGYRAIQDATEALERALESKEVSRG